MNHINSLKPGHASINLVNIRPDNNGLLAVWTQAFTWSNAE